MLVRVTLGENPAAPRPEVGYGCQKCQLIIGEGTNELKRLAGHAMATPYTPESIVRRTNKLKWEIFLYKQISISILI